MWSVAFLTHFVAAVHPVVEGGVVLVPFFLAFASLAVVGEILGHPVGPAVGDGLTFRVETLGNADFAIGFLGVVGVCARLVLVAVGELDDFLDDCLHVGGGGGVG